MQRADFDLELLVRDVIDCGFRLHDDLGPGLLESAYETLLAAAIAERGHQVQRQHPVQISYRGVTLRDAFRIDLLVERILIIEVKSVDRLAPVHARQVLTYLRLTERPLGLLMNFGAHLFRYGVKRVINDRADFVGRPLGRHE